MMRRTSPEIKEGRNKEIEGKKTEKGTKKKV
jgi:hypothetical protein